MRDTHQTNFEPATPLAGISHLLPQPKEFSLDLFGISDVA
jgi:hypothetical protein